MTDTIQCTFQVLQTTLQIIYANITDLSADVFVSSDDVHLSMTGGVAGTLRRVAGDTPRDDTRKHSLPVQVGDVIVSSAGKLNGKYIFHAITIDFNLVSQPDVTVIRLVERILDLATSLQIRTIAVPLLGAGTVGLERTHALELIVRHIASYLTTHKTPLQTVTVVMYMSHTDDHLQSEQQLVSQLATFYAEVERWNKTSTRLNDRVRICRGLQELLTAQDVLYPRLNAQIAADLKQLRELFGADTALERNSEQIPFGSSDYAGLKERLMALIEELSQEITDIAAVERATRRRKNALERRKAQQGYATPPEVTIELEEIERNLAEQARRSQQASEQLTLARNEMQQMTDAWAQQS